jgi:RimJ/RimL family protein N-acetyltransferase
MTTIEELAPSDFDLVAGWLSNPEINQWLTSEWRGKAITSTVVSFMMRSKKNRVFLARWNGEPAGLTALADIDSADATAMVWYFLGVPALSRRGIISAALGQMAAKSFQDLKLKSLYAWVMDDNLGSIGVLRKAGFREAGRIRQATCSHGRQVDRIYFDLVPNECPVA